jgi:plastocyanin
LGLILKTRKDAYFSGETVRIVGVVTPTDKASVMDIQIYGPTNLPVRYEQVSKSVDSCYYFYFRPENESDIGKYVVEAKGADQTAKTSFSYLSGQSGETIRIKKTTDTSFAQKAVTFEPPDLFVDYGVEITWVSQDSEVHKIISGDPLTLQPNHIFSTSFIPPGKSFSIQLGPLVSDKLEIDYYCQLHPWETGRLLIKNFPRGDLKKVRCLVNYVVFHES